ncbi:MAG: hypothetical protein OXG65_15745 [Chloroflexi bacterium]|nr:hypothetical protein [Chloroflexota bacterium]
MCPDTAPEHRLSQQEESEQIADDTKSIGEKVKFWEEQDKINQVLIPRVIRQNEILTQHLEHHPDISDINKASIRALAQATRKYEEHVKEALAVAKEDLLKEVKSAVSESQSALRRDQESAIKEASSGLRREFNIVANLISAKLNRTVVTLTAVAVLTAITYIVLLSLLLVDIL